jgi:YHS domain-containing protein
MSMGTKLKSDPQLFSVYNGKTCLFSNKMAKDNFDADPAMYVKKADAEFAKLKS